MRILIAGASGLIGQLLVNHWSKIHELVLLGRNQQQLTAQFKVNNPVQTVDWQHLQEIDAQKINVVINLCGKNIADARWSEKIKQELISSRTQTNRSLCDWLIKNEAKPHYYTASAIGIYGAQPFLAEHEFDEESSIDDQNPPDFLSQIGIEWEQSMQQAEEAKIPVTYTRFGVVLKKNAGMLHKLLPLFNWGLGSIVGNGSQNISWISSKDLVAAFDFLLANPQLTGAINLTSPEPVNQKEFAKILAQVIHRPLLLKTPAWVLKILYGEMGEALLLKGQRVVPKRLLENGFQFNYPKLKDALLAELKPNGFE